MTHKFTTPCFIRKNDPELRKKLEELGYKIINSGDTTLDAHNFDGRGHHKHIDEGTAIITSYGGYYGVVYVADDVTNKGRIDCGTNENLFLTLVELKKDTYEGQWFVMDVEVYVDIPKGTWFKATNRNGGRHIGTQIDPLHCHKATVEEIIEHFKNN